ncbi:MAG: addiction module toxin RelE [Firmicutes bacterium]|nr:addiction module toxin RelE [Bacillota bacterium]
MELSIFQNHWRLCGLDEDDLLLLQKYLSENPNKGDVIPGTKGIRKLRWAAKHKGKRGGIRVIYIHFPKFNKIYLLAAYSKNQKIKLSPTETNNLNEIIEMIKKELNNNERI